MISVSFGRWSHAAGALFIFKRIYWNGVTWTPLVRMFWRYCKDDAPIPRDPDLNIAYGRSEPASAESDNLTQRILDQLILLDKLMEQLHEVAGDEGCVDKAGEGAVECLQRIIRERKQLKEEKALLISRGIYINVGPSP